ncbi:MAG TPA: glycoside hydrolase family 2 TIM barrel-domain containing protein [Verrucomicrobiae bacterium]
MNNRFLLPVLLAALSFRSPSMAAGRHTQSLDGRWRIADSISASEMPPAFPGTVPVPGLANLAQPAFPDVDQFISRENLANKIRAKLVPAEWLTNYWTGKVDQDRDYFWYQKTFKAPSPRAVALLKINKAQFGTAVWLNGKPLGEYAGCFTASYFVLNDAIRWNAENSLVVRVGAHPAVLPDTYPTGSDFEKIKWTPGIYDSVSVIYCDNPVIETIQVAPRIATSEIVVQTRVKNHATTPARATLTHVVKTWKGGKRAGESTPESISLQPGEEKVFTQTLRIANAHLWSPEDPFLYVMESSTGGDFVTTRFGLREFRFDAATKRAYLNGKVYYLRGSNITLHRFFEDPLCKDLPWREAWVRKLLGDLPKKMHWNYFRFCIGPVPDRWLDICDEVGLLIQNEFFVWTGGPGWYQGYSRTHDADEMIRQYKDWMRDNWNHPSVAVWDANNETKDDLFGAKIIPAVRPLDLSNRPWENSYNQPADPNDPVEHHPYLMISGYRGKLTFNMTQLETMDSRPNPGQLPSDTNPPLINEYGWLWLNRDGSPTLLTENVYAQLMGTNVTARERLDLYAYLLGAKTEFWRAHRQYAGIIHFVYLTCSYPGVYTADHFADVTKLKLDPAFADYLGEAFKPLGVYLNFFQPILKAGAARYFTVMLVNDDAKPLRGQLTLTLETKSGRVLARTEQSFALPELGAQTLKLPLPIPNSAGDCVFKAAARADGQSKKEATISRRWVKLAE